MRRVVQQLDRAGRGDHRSPRVPAGELLVQSAELAAHDQHLFQAGVEVAEGVAAFGGGDRGVAGDLGEDFQGFFGGPCQRLQGVLQPLLRKIRGGGVVDRPTQRGGDHTAQGGVDFAVDVANVGDGDDLFAGVTRLGVDDAGLDSHSSHISKGQKKNNTPEREVKSMSLYKGAHITATAAGSGTTRTFTFANPCGVVYFVNNHSAEAYIRINNTEDAAAISHGNHDVRVPANTGVELCQGLLQIDKMAVIWGSDPTAAYSVTGIPTTQK